MNAQQTTSDLHHFDVAAQSLMRGRRIRTPNQLPALTEYIERNAALIESRFNEPEMGLVPPSAGANATDAETIGFLRRRFRAALADGLRLAALARRTDVGAIETRMNRIVQRARAALGEIEMGDSGRFASLLPSNREQEKTD